MFLPPRLCWQEDAIEFIDRLACEHHLSLFQILPSQQANVNDSQPIAKNAQPLDWAGI